LVPTAKLFVVCPAGTLIVGAEAASSRSELASVTAVPPAGAAALSVTVQVDVPPLPPLMTDGLHDSAVGVCAEALGTTSANAINPRPGTKQYFFVASLDVTSYLLRYCTLAVTDAAAFSVNVHVFVLLPPLEHAPDQIALRPPEAVSVIDVPVLNDADPVLPTETLIPDGVDVMRSPLRPVAFTVSVACPPGGGVLCGVKLRVDDQAPAVPAALTPRTRHQCCRAASDVAVNCDAATV